ncbi:branched-chain amino acid ABC transporter permease [Xanthobacter oligotrophicus]|uniref:Branched-chain amino acid ABC transporter permease n=1 Tax=Xanthobacter oligotrophicus TaxID=2607286 RepID=A0ABW6ZU95_9HYPH
MLIFAIAALSLDLILGQAGLVSFGHALYLGLGAYVVGILADAGIESGFIQWPLAMLVSATVAAGLSVVALRTSGTFFIMITLAFAQMMYYGASSLYDYGGDDGMHLAVRSTFAGLIDLYESEQFYYLVLALLALLTGLYARLSGARFGQVLRGIRVNERRMQAVGFPTFRYKLAACVISAAVCGLAGALLANAAEFVGPQFMDWTRSAELMIMVVAGGLATPLGPVVGALAYLGLEKYLSDLTIHWRIAFGGLLILVVFLGRGGLAALFAAAPGRAEAEEPRGAMRWARPFLKPKA